MPEETQDAQGIVRSMKKIKVLHVLWTGRIGGAERFIRDIITYSDREKFEHAVCYLSDGGVLAQQISR